MGIRPDTPANVGNHKSDLPRYGSLHWTPRLNDGVAFPGRDRILTVLGPYHHGSCAHHTVLSTGPHASMTMGLSQVESVPSRHVGRIIAELGP